MPAPAYVAITDNVILGRLQDALLEVNNGGTAMTTAMYSTAQLVNSLNQASLDFQKDTGLVVCHLGFQGDSLNGLNVVPGTEQVQLPQDMVDVRRLAWIAFNPTQSQGNIVQATSGWVFANANSLAFPSPISSSDALVAFGVATGTAAITPADSQSNSWTALSATATVQSWYALNAASGATSVRFSGFSANEGMFVILGELRGLATSGAVDTVSSTLATGTVCTSAVTTTNATDVILCYAAAFPNVQGIAKGSESALIEQIVQSGQATATALLEYQTTTATGTVTSTVIAASGATAGVNMISAAFKMASAPTNTVLSVTELPRQDSFALDALTPGWENSLGQPYTADESLPPVPAINLSSQPSDIGQVDILYTPVPTQLSNTGVPLSFPPDFAVPIFWRALEILFSLQGEGADDARARAAGQMYRLWVSLAKSLQFMTNLVPVQGA